jgi:hypothetical protein
MVRFVRLERQQIHQRLIADDDARGVNDALRAMSSSTNAMSRVRA